MKTEKIFISNLKKISRHFFSLKFQSDDFSRLTKPGQFINIKISDNQSFILRRPFSVAQIENSTVEIIFDVVGKGTKHLSDKKIGDELDVLGPLGNGFNLNGEYDIAILIGGGIGIAPFPFLIKELNKRGKIVHSYLGFKNKDLIISLPSDKTLISTDDGSFGFNGNVIDLFNSEMYNYKERIIKIFSCGPNSMLKALNNLNDKYDFEAEVSVESYMACGFGICQGCPVESKIEENKYYMVCKDGPCFNLRTIKI